MRKLLFVSFLFACTLLSSMTRGLGQGARPIPPGVRDAPAKFDRRHTDPAKLQQEADELAKLSAAIPDQVAIVAKGRLPKDLADQLKRIEKLAKHLRSEISN
jgi:hypothetical protein